MFPDAQVNIATKCVTYLSFDVFGELYSLGYQELKPILKSNPLLEYAASHWGHHAHGNVEDIVKETVVQLLQKKQNIAFAIQVLLSRSDFFRGDYRLMFKGQFSVMHLLSYFGLEKMICHQLENGAEADSKDKHRRSPLSFAARYEHQSVVKLLLTRDDIEVNLKDARHRHCRGPLLMGMSR